MTKNLSLLEKAKQIPAKSRKSNAFTEEELDLVLAWINDEIGLHQMQKALNLSSGNGAYLFIARACRQMLGKNGRK